MKLDKAEGTSKLPKLMKPQNARSPFWEHFGLQVDDRGVKIDPNRVIFKLCTKDLKFSGNTTNLRQHLESNHREVLPGTSNAASSDVKLEGAARQMTLHLTSAKTQKFSSGSPQGAKITMAVADFVPKDLRPIATVEGEGFVHLLSMMEPRYHVPSRKHVTAVLKGKYDKLKVEVLEELAQVEAVALTGDFGHRLLQFLTWELLPTLYHQTGI